MKKCKEIEYKKIVDFIKKLYGKDKVALHEPVFIGNEKKYLEECIDSTFVSSVGEYVDKFEKSVAEFTGAKYAVAVVNGTAALHISLKVLGVDENNEVITQPLTFVATCNAISYCGAKPIFVDVDLDTLGMSPKSLKNFLEENTTIKNGKCINKKTQKIIKACVPMHTFGHPCKIDEIVEICKEFNIDVVEDAAESLGSFYKGKHTGTFGKLGVFSFNGNKIITTGGGGMVVTDDKNLAKRVKHLTTTAKVSHPWEYIHDEVGYNYRMPNINAALGLAQIENLEKFIKIKRELANTYKEFFNDFESINFFEETQNAKSNYWLNAIIFENPKSKEEFLEYSNNNGVMTRPVWKLMHKLSIYEDCQRTDLSNAEFLYERIVNIPGGVIKRWIS